MPRPPDPWDQRPGETNAAYAAFLIYRDLGTLRTVRDAYRQRTGIRAAKQASGGFNKWFKKHDWERRAAAWDVKDVKAAEEATRRAIEAAAAKAVRTWAKVRDDQLTKSLEAGAVLERQGLTMARLPLTQVKVKDADGNPVVIEPADPRTIAAAARVVGVSQEIIWQAIDRGLRVEQDVAPPVRDGRDASTDAEGLARVLANRARLRDELLRAPAGPPKADGHSNGNGHGNGAAH